MSTRRAYRAILFMEYCYEGMQGVDKKDLASSANHQAAFLCEVLGLYDPVFCDAYMGHFFNGSEEALIKHALSWGYDPNY